MRRKSTENKEKLSTRDRAKRKGMSYINVFLTRALHERLKDFSEEICTPCSVIVRMAIKSHLKKYYSDYNNSCYDEDTYEEMYNND